MIVIPQRHKIRSKIEKCGPKGVVVWGKPVNYILAKYKAQMMERCTLQYYLLAVTMGLLVFSLSSEHHKFVSVAAQQVLPTFFRAWPTYLTILLLDRTYRIDERCLQKYGNYWREYCAQVPYKLIPGLW